jgi:hypothetical protein
MKNKNVSADESETEQGGAKDIVPLKRRDSNRRVIAWISDTHVLSPYALCPEGFVTDEGNILQLNPAQKQLLGYWKQFQKVCDELAADTVCIVGDVMHGQNPKELGIGLMNTHMDMQIGAAISLLKPICRRRRVFMWSGSGYHIGPRGHNTERDICNHEDLVKETESTHWMGPISNVTFRPSEKLFNVQHGVSAAFIYRTMLMDRDTLFMREAESIGKIPKIDVLVKAHWHSFIHLHQKGKHSIQLPCWQIFTPWKGSLLSYGKMQPDIGGVITVLDDKDRLRVWHFLYDLPHIVDIPSWG